MEEIKEGAENMKEGISPRSNSEGSKQINSRSHGSIFYISLEDSSSERLNPYMTSSSQSQSEDDLPPRKISKSRSRSRSRSHSNKKEGGKSGRHHSKREAPRKSSRVGSAERKTSIVRPGLNGPLLSYKHFMDLQRGVIDPEEAERCYNKYKNDHMQKQNEIFFHMHKVWYCKAR